LKGWATSPFFVCAAEVTDIHQVLESTAASLGYELVHHELAQGGRLVRVFIERTDVDEGGARPSITHVDCQRLTRQLQRVLEVEGIGYERLEVSSPGLDRVLKKPADFQRFAGERAEVRLRVPLNGQRRFVGVVRGASAEEVELEVEGTVMSFAFVNLDKARLVPKLGRERQ
jgi:ribosome maturation factor RimP